MVDVTRPGLLDETYGSVLCSRKADFVSVADRTTVAQHGAASIDAAGWPGWPDGLSSADAAIETFVAGVDQVTATSHNEPFVSAWQPLAQWMNQTVRTELARFGVGLAGDAYVTASLTTTSDLEGVAHLDDDQFVPTDSVSMVAIIGEHVGPRVATAPIEHRPLRPMAPVSFDDTVLDAFAGSEIDHCQCSADDLVVFPQFGQLHAGPAAAHLAGLGATRQLLVMRAQVATS